MTGRQTTCLPVADGAGHAVCSSSPWLNGLNVFNTGESYPPEPQRSQCGLPPARHVGDRLGAVPETLLVRPAGGLGGEAFSKRDGVESRGVAPWVVQVPLLDRRRAALSLIVVRTGVATTNPTTSSAASSGTARLVLQALTVGTAALRRNDTSRVAEGASRCAEWFGCDGSVVAGCAIKCRAARSWRNTSRASLRTSGRVGKRGCIGTGASTDRARRHPLRYVVGLTAPSYLRRRSWWG